MPDRHVLQEHYKHWDDFVSQWLGDGKPEDGKRNEDFLPEPWWGWTIDSKFPLNSVVINLHPGKGGTIQTRKAVKPVIGNCKYSNAMTGALPRHLPETHKWHNSYRAKPLLSRLQELHAPLSNAIDRHLSIELSPYHSPTSKDVESYVTTNYQEVVENTLQFAADASRLIEGPLNSTVIVRCNAQRFCKMFHSLDIKPCSPNQDLSKSPYWFTIPLQDFEGVRFVCVWGARNFLPKKDINEIINRLKTNNK